MQMTLFHCFKIDSDCCSFNEVAAVTAENSIFKFARLKIEKLKSKTCKKIVPFYCRSPVCSCRCQLQSMLQMTCKKVLLLCSTALQIKLFFPITLTKIVTYLSKKFSPIPGVPYLHWGSCQGGRLFFWLYYCIYGKINVLCYDLVHKVHATFIFLDLEGQRRKKVGTWKSLTNNLVCNITFYVDLQKIVTYTSMPTLLMIYVFTMTCKNF